MNALAEADRRERDALDEGLEQLHAGWTPAEVLAVLVDAWATIDAIRCDRRSPRWDQS